MKTAFSSLRLAKELKALQKNPDLGFSVGLKNEDNLYVWNICLEGPPDSIYSRGYYNAELTFPQTYPNDPPTMRFKTTMWHPNIYPDGNVCISILHPSGVDQFNPEEKCIEKWRPILGVEAILISVLSMLEDPNLSSPANTMAAKQYKEDYDGYKKRVKQLANKSIENM